MPVVDLKLTHATLHRLQATAGLKLHGLQHSGSLAAGSRIEVPAAVQATVTGGSFLEVGAFCSLSGGNIGNVRFKRYCSLAHGTVMGAHEHPTDWLTSSRTAYWPQVHAWDRFLAPERAEAIHAETPRFTASCPITEIGNDVWIGHGAFIKAGVTIGDGAVVGARSTVVKDVPPYAIVVGTPAKIIRPRFAERTIERLLALQWWRYSIYDLAGVPFDDVERAIDAIEARVADDAIQPYAPAVVTVEDLAAVDTWLDRSAAA